MTNKTLDQLSPITTPQSTDLIAILRPIAGALQNITWSSIVTALATTFASRANNLSDLADATASRTNLGLGTAATQNTGTSGATVPLLNTSVSWTGTVTATGFIGPLAGNVTGNVSGSSGSCTGNAATATTASAVAAGVVAPAGLTTGHPGWGSGFFYPFDSDKTRIWVERDAGNGNPRLHFLGSGGSNFMEFDTVNNRVYFVLNGITAGHVDAATGFTNDV